MSSQQAKPTASNETVLFVGMGMLLAVAAVMWLTGQLAGLANSSRWPHVSLADIPRAFVALVRHPSDPTNGWPKTAGVLMPGPVVFYLIATFVIAALTAAVVFTFRLHKRLADH